MTAQRALIPALMIAAGLMCTGNAQAQPYGNAWGHAKHNNGSAYDTGYRRGFEQGRDDARRGRYDYNRADVYRSGDLGYDRAYGDRNDYRNVFRQGFAAGYDDGFYGRGQRGYTRSDGYYPGPVYGNNYPPNGNYPVYGNNYPYGNSYPTSPQYGRYGGGYAANAGLDRGYQDGLDKGRNDGKHHDQYDPRRQKWYRDADRGYKDDYGSRSSYEAAYRDGFLRGYDEGYRQNGGTQHRWW